MKTDLESEKELPITAVINRKEGRTKNSQLSIESVANYCDHSTVCISSAATPAVNRAKSTQSLSKAGSDAGSTRTAANTNANALVALLPCCMQQHVIVYIESKRK